MKLRLAVSAALLAMATLTPALSADLKYKPGEGPFHWDNFDALKKMDLKGETLTIFGPWRGDWRRGSPVRWGLCFRASATCLPISSSRSSWAPASSRLPTSAMT